MGPVATTTSDLTDPTQCLRSNNDPDFLKGPKRLGSGLGKSTQILITLLSWSGLS